METFRPFELYPLESSGQNSPDAETEIKNQQQ
jgi:hypothetical protein